MTSRVIQCDVKHFYRLVLIKSNHIVLATFGVHCDSRFAFHVWYKKFIKSLMASLNYYWTCKHTYCRRTHGRMPAQSDTKRSHCKLKYIERKPIADAYAL